MDDCRLEPVLADLLSRAVFVNGGVEMRSGVGGLVEVDGDDGLGVSLSRRRSGLGPPRECRFDVAVGVVAGTVGVEVAAGIIMGASDRQILVWLALDI
jgi:hypothetical protein